MKVEDFWDKWICDKTLIYRCIEMYDELNALEVDVGQFNSCITRNYGAVLENYDMDGGRCVNSLGLFRYIAHKTIFPYQNKKEDSILLYCETRKCTQQ